MILEGNKHGRDRVERKAVYTIDQILPLIGSGVKKLDEDVINFNYINLKLVARLGTKCFLCGLEGAFFAKEYLIANGDLPFKCGRLYALQLYAIKDGEEILINRDHILPKSKGGKGNLNNLQPTCFDCNQNKSGTPPEPMREFHDLNSTLITPRGHWPKHKIVEVAPGMAIYDDGN
jgi:hypothetical protein